MKYLIALLAIVVHCQSVNAQPAPHDISKATQIEFLKSRIVMIEADLRLPFEMDGCANPSKRKIAYCVHLEHQAKLRRLAEIYNIKKKIDYLNRDDQPLSSIKTAN